MFRYLKAVLWSFCLREKHAFELIKKTQTDCFDCSWDIGCIVFIVALIGFFQIVVSNQQILESSEGRS